MGVVIVLIIIIAILIAYLLLLKKEIRSIGKQLHQLPGGIEKPVDISFVDNDVTDLASGINDVLSYQKENRVETLKREYQLKEAISNVSHDLRTPLTSIVGYTQLLQKTDLDSEQREFVETILTRSEDLRELISDFYDISIWETKECVPELKKINLDNILANSILGYTDQFTKKAILPKVIFLDEPTFVIADEAMLKRVVDNLISNAVTYGIGELSITISKTESVSVTFRNAVHNGQTIDVNRLFDKYYTADLSRSHSGTGLGLYIVKLLMEKMRGTAKAVCENNMVSIVLSFEKTNL